MALFFPLLIQIWTQIPKLLGALNHATHHPNIVKVVNIGSAERIRYSFEIVFVIVKNIRINVVFHFKEFLLLEKGSNLAAVSTPEYLLLSLHGPVGKQWRSQVGEYSAK